VIKVESVFAAIFNRLNFISTDFEISLSTAGFVYYELG
jgi:hypothetical protein